MKEQNQPAKSGAPEVIEGRISFPLPLTRVQADALVHWADLLFGLDALEVRPVKVSAPRVKEPLDAAARLLQGVVLDWQPERARDCRVVCIPCSGGDVHVLLVKERQETVHFSLDGLEGLLSGLGELGLEVM